MTASTITKGDRFFLLNKCTEGSRISKCHQNPSTTAYIISCIATKLAALTTPGTFSGWFLIMFLIFHLVLKECVFVNVILLVINRNKTEMSDVFLFKPGFGNVTKKLYVEF